MATIASSETSLLTTQSDLAMSGVGVSLTRRVKSFSRNAEFTVIDDSAAYDWWGMPLCTGGQMSGQLDAKYTADAADKFLQSLYEFPAFPQPIVYAEAGAAVGARATGVVLSPSDGSASAPAGDAQMRSYSGTRTVHVNGQIGSAVSAVGDNMFRHEDDANWRSLAETVGATSMETTPHDTKDKGIAGAGHVAVGKPIFVWYTYRSLAAPSASMTASGTWDISATRAGTRTLTFTSSVFCGRIALSVAARDSRAAIVSAINDAAAQRAFPLLAETAGANSLKLTYRDPVGVLTIGGSFAAAVAGMAGILYPSGPIATVRNITGTGARAVKTAIAGPFQLWAASTEPRHIVGYAARSGGNTSLLVQTSTAQVMSLQYMHGFFGEQ